MDKVKVSEALLRRITTREDASTIAGDLQEQHASAMACAGVVLRMLFAATWRYAAGAVAGLVLAMVALTLVATLWKFELPANESPVVYPWWDWRVSSLLASMCLWIVAALALFRFGLRDRQSVTALVWAFAATAIACMGWAPYPNRWMPVAFVMFAGVMLSVSATRRASWSVVASGATFAAFFGGCSNILSHFKLPAAISVVVGTAGMAWLCAIALAVWVLLQSRYRWIEDPKQLA